MAAFLILGRKQVATILRNISKRIERGDPSQAGPSGISLGQSEPKLTRLGEGSELLEEATKELPDEVEARGGNTHMPQVIKSPTECTEEELDEFKGMVLKGEQVEEAKLEDRIKRARHLAFKYDQNQLVGIAALKRPSDKYKQDVFKKAGIPEQAKDYELEIGWAFTEKEHRGRGVSGNLIRGLLEISEPHNIFATTRTNNKAMDRILLKHGFTQCGKPYLGRDCTYQLQLYVRPGSSRP